MSLTALLFLSVFGFFLFKCITAHPIFGLYAYIMALYMDPANKWWFDSLPALPWSFVASLFTLFVIFTKPQFNNPIQWYRSTPIILFLLFLFWMCLQYFWVINSNIHSSGVTLFSKYALLLCLIYTVCHTSEMVKNFLFACVLGSFYIGWQGYTTRISGRMEGIGGAGFSDANTVGMYLAAILFIAFFLTLLETKWRKLIVFACLPFILNALILAASRGAFLSVFVAGLVAIYFKPKSIRRLFYVGAIVGGFGIAYLGSESFVQRMVSVQVAASGEEEADSSAASRGQILSYQWEMALDHPFGVGFKGTAILSRNYMPESLLTKGKVRGSHNTLAAVLVSHGWPGLILYSCILIWAAKKLFFLIRIFHRREDNENSLLISMLACGFTVHFVSGLFSNYFKAEILIWLLALLSAMVSNQTQKAIKLRTKANSAPVSGTLSS